MTTLKVNDFEELQTVITSNPNVVVDFSAPSWCVPCQRLAPHYRAAALNLRESWVFAEVDIDQAPEIQAHYGIMSVPTVLKFVNGQQVGPVQGRTALALVKELS